MKSGMLVFLFLLFLGLRKKGEGGKQRERGGGSWKENRKMHRKEKEEKGNKN